MKLNKLLPNKKENNKKESNEKAPDVDFIENEEDKSSHKRELTDQEKKDISLALSQKTFIQKYKTEKSFHQFISFLTSTFILIVSLYLLFSNVITVTRTTGNSMYPLINDNKYVVINNFSYVYKSPQQGDIVTYLYNNSELMGRIIGYPGDIIEIKNGIVYINNYPTYETYNNFIMQDFKAITVDENSFFILNDNRNCTIDSRTLGCVNYKQITGRYLFTVEVPNFVNSLKNIKLEALWQH